MVNPINVNPQGIGNSYGYNLNAKPEDKKETKEAQAPAAAQTSQVAAEDVLGYMAQSAVSVTPATKAIDTSKYVDEASAKRIAGFMQDFEGVVATNLAAISKEFPGMSDSSKQALALAQTDAQA